MQNDPTDPKALTRRQVIVAAAAAALVASAPAVLATNRPKRRDAASNTTQNDTPVRRYMAAAAVLPDGRILVSGGYGQRWNPNSPPPALSSAMIYDPRSATWFEAAGMNLPRARHAAVALQDGRVAVLGGIGFNPTASVEIYDSRTDSWQISASLEQARYDHAAVSDGQNIYVLGGNSQSSFSGVELFRPDTAPELSPRL